jgi:hypothetical protein
MNFLLLMPPIYRTKKSMEKISGKMEKMGRALLANQGWPGHKYWKPYPALEKTHNQPVPMNKI